MAEAPSDGVATGRSVEEAVAAGARALGIRPEEARVEVLQEAGRGWLGIGGRDARVRVSRPSKGDAARRFLEEFARRLGAEADVEVEGPVDPEAPWVIGVATADAGRWIGHRGQTLEALRTLTDVVATRVSGSRDRLALDVGGYRERHEHELRETARRAAERARRLGRDIMLDPMPAADRRVVHLAAREVGGVETSSVGEEPLRRVVIAPQR